MKKDVFYWSPEGEEGVKLAAKARDYDVIDLLYRNRAGDAFNVNDQLGRIKADALIIHIKNDQWLRYLLAEETAGRIPTAELVGFEHPLAHYALFRAPNVLKAEVEAFFSEIGMD